MATTYTHENFTPSAVPVVFKKDVAALIAKAVDLGWTFMVKADNNATLIAPAPNEEQNIHLSARRNSGPLRRLNSKIEKYGKQPVAAAPKAKPETKRVSLDLLGDSVVDWDAAEELNAFNEAQEVLDTTEADAAVEFEAVEVETLVADALKEIVSTGPMVCTKDAHGATYESNIATQREWSDGSVDYVCSKCDYTHVNRRSMASHWKWHVREDESLRQVPLPITDERVTMADTLRAVLENGVDWTDLDKAAAQLAAAAVRHGGMIEPYPQAGAPTSDAEVLDAIRALVGGDQSDQITQLEKRVAALEADLDAAKADAAAAKSTLATFRDLINESV